MLYSNRIWHIPKLVSICLKNRHQIDDFWRFLKILELFQSFHQITDIVIKQIYAYAVLAWYLGVCQFIEFFYQMQMAKSQTLNKYRIIWKTVRPVL